MSEDERLEELFGAYRAACPDPEAGAGFMPGLWDKIESRRRSTIFLRRWTSAFVAAATAVSLFMAVDSVRQNDSLMHTLSYVDTLGADEPFETFAYGDLAHLESPDTLGMR
jgi:hypothetical protein